jgi:hypothetical protein
VEVEEGGTHVGGLEIIALWRLEGWWQERCQEEDTPNVL